MRFLWIAALPTACAACNLIWGTDGLRYDHDGVHGAGSDGAAEGGSAAAFSAPKQRAIACGNGQLDDGETCDDDNTSGGDGCSSACQIEGAPGGCIDVPQIKLGPAGVAIAGSTTGAQKQAQSSCTEGVSGTHHYAIEALDTGTLEFAVTAPNTGYDVAFAITETCGDAPNELECVRAEDAAGGTTHDFFSGQVLHVRVNGHTGRHEGDYVLTIRY